jgi:hypothetical protein
MHFPQAFVFAALPFLGLVSAAVVEQPAASVSATPGRVSIGIQKRTQLKRASGAVDAAALRTHAAYAAAKVQRGLEAFERNTGTTHPSSLGASGSGKRNTGAEPLTDDSEQLWYGHISVGTPPIIYSGQHLSAPSYLRALMSWRSRLRHGKQRPLPPGEQLRLDVLRTHQVQPGKVVDIQGARQELQPRVR